MHTTHFYKHLGDYHFDHTGSGDSNDTDNLMLIDEVENLDDVSIMLISYDSDDCNQLLILSSKPTRLHPQHLVVLATSIASYVFVKFV